MSALLWFANQHLKTCKSKGEKESIDMQTASELRDT